MLLAWIAVLAFLASFVVGIGRNHNQRPVPVSDAAPQPIAVPDSRVRVQVLNGSSRSGLARLATDQLRDAGYDVVSIGNASSPARTSVVLDRTGKREIAERVAATLGIARIEARPDTALYLEVTVILGPDFKSRPKASTQ